VLEDIHAADGLLLVVDTGDGWVTDDAWSHVQPHVPHLNYVTATGFSWDLYLPHTFILDLATHRVIAKDPQEGMITPAEILSAVQGNDT
jgi:hypothetical protein